MQMWNTLLSIVSIEYVESFLVAVDYLQLVIFASFPYLCLSIFSLLVSLLLFDNRFFASFLSLSLILFCFDIFQSFLYQSLFFVSLFAFFQCLFLCFFSSMLSLLYCKEKQESIKKKMNDKEKRVLSNNWDLRPS